MRAGRGEFLLARAEKDAMNLRICDGASDLLRRKCMDLNLVWSSTSMRAYWYPPCKVRTNGPAMSAWIRRPACEGLYRQLSCGSRVAFASVQASQPLCRPRASAGGASAVMEGSVRRRVDPACSRRCMWRVASLGDITLMWCDDLDACVARHRPSRSSQAGTYFRSDSCVPSAAGGVTIARVSPNTQLVEVDCHSWLTESSESENEGTQRTSRRVRSTDSPLVLVARR
eukprot:6173458-Pleurochrysis_carterae.AAC.1